MKPVLRDAGGAPVIVWLWAADGPSSGGLGIAGDQGSARQAAEGRLRSGAAATAVVEEATAGIGIPTLADGYCRTRGCVAGAGLRWPYLGARAPRPATGRIMTVPQYVQAAGVVRAQVADGDAEAGRADAERAALARVTGFSVLTYRKALPLLVASGVLVPGASPAARPRVASSGPDASGEASAARGLPRLADLDPRRWRLLRRHSISGAAVKQGFARTVAGDSPGEPAEALAGQRRAEKAAAAVLGSLG